MAFDFSQIPGGGGSLGPVLNGIGIAVDAALCAATAGLACFKLVIDVFLEIFELWFGDLFEGRQTLGKDSATDDLALFFIASSNPVCALRGMGIRLLEAQGFPISSSDPAVQAHFARLDTAWENDLKRQFTTGALLAEQYSYLGSLKNPDSNTPALDGRAVLDTIYTQAVARGQIDPKTGFPPPGSPPVNPLQPSTTPGPCTDPCQQEMQSIVTGQVVPPLIATAAALSRLANTLADNGDPNATTHAQEIAAALTDLATCVCADFNALVNHWMPSIFGTLPPAGEPGILTTLFNLFSPALERIAEAADTYRTHVPTPQALIDALKKSGALRDGEAAVIEQGSWPHDLISVVGDWWNKQWAKFAAAQIEAAKDDPLTGAAYSRVTTGTGVDLTDLSKVTTSSLSDFLETALQTMLTHYLGLSSATWGEVADLVLKVIDARLATLGPVAPGGQDTVAKEMLGDAFGLGLGAHYAAGIAESIYPTKALGLPQLAALMCDLAGFKEIAGSYHGPNLEHGIRRPASYEAAAKFQSTKPGLAGILPLFGRGKINLTQAQQYLAWQGFNPTEATTQLKGAYRPVSPFLLERGFVNRPYPAPLIHDALVDMGMDPRFIDTVNTMLENLTTQQVENQYLTELQTAYAKGAIPLSDLTDAMNGLGYSPAAQNLIQQRATVVQQIELIATVVKEYAPELAAGIVTPAQYGQALTAAGAQDWFVQQQVALATAKQFTRGVVKAQAIAHRDAQTIWTHESNTAVELYVKGETDLAALTAAVTAAREVFLSSLAEAGISAAELAGEESLSPVLITSIVATAQAKTVLSKQFIFGLYMPRAAAQTLKEEVAALEQQYKGLLITDVQLLQALFALGIPGADAEGILAKLAAGTRTAHSYAELLKP